MLRVGRGASAPAVETASLAHRGDLGGFAFSALSTWGTLHDLKHFLPRLLELVANGTLRTDLQQIYGKLVQDGPWLEAELEALERFTRALFVRSMSGHRPPPVDVLESAGLAGMDVAALLDAAFAVRSPERTTALARLIWDQAASLASGVPHWIWWRDDQDLALRRWLSSRDAYAVLVAAFEADPDHPDAGEWAQAADVLEALGR